MPGTPGRSGGYNRKQNPRRGRKRLAPPGLSPDAFGRPGRPEWIAADLVACESWDRTVSLLEARGTITPADRDAVLLATVAESEYRKADALIVAEGLVVDGRPHPAAKIRESAWKRWSSALSRLGLDPLTRGRVQPAPQQPAGNPYQEH